MKLMIEPDENSNGVNVTTDEEEMSVETAIFMLELAKLSVMSYHLGGTDTSQQLDDQRSSSASDPADRKVEETKDA